MVRKLLSLYKSQIDMKSRSYQQIAVSRIQGNGFMADHHAAAPEGGMVIGIDLTAAIAPDNPVSMQEIVSNAFSAAAKKSCGLLSRFAAPRSPEDKERGWKGKISTPIARTLGLR